MLMQILMHTPKWVFVLFAALLWLGVRQSLPRRVKLKRVMVMPIAIVILSIWGVLSGFGDSPLALLAWVAGAGLSALLLGFPLPAGTRYDAVSGSFWIPGSIVPLVLLMGIFFAKYAVGAALAMHPEIAHRNDAAVAVGVLYGIFSGIFIVRALRLWRLSKQ
jgi:hypothetical protein